MHFIDDLIPDLAWLSPAPIGTVEDGWADIVTDLLRDIDVAVARRPGTTVDVLTVAERDGELLFDAVVDGVAADDDHLIAVVERAALVAKARAAATCARCGRPGSLRRERPGWPTTRCDRHAGAASDEPRPVTRFNA